MDTALRPKREGKLDGSSKADEVNPTRLRGACSQSELHKPHPGPKCEPRYSAPPGVLPSIRKSGIGLTLPLKCGNCNGLRFQ